MQAHEPSSPSLAPSMYNYTYVYDYIFMIIYIYIYVRYLYRAELSLPRAFEHEAVFFNDCETT